VAAEEAHSDAVADPPGGHVRTYGVDDDDLVAGNDRQTRIGPEPFDAEGVAVAYPAAADADAAQLGCDDLECSSRRKRASSAEYHSPPQARH
jgi:hypothetical protein